MQNKFSLLLCVFTGWVCAQQSQLAQADSLYSFGNYSKAIGLYEKYPDANAVSEKLAKSFLAIGNYDKAVLYYNEAVLANPNDLLLKYELAKLLRGTKKYKESKLLFGELIAADSLNPNFWYEQGLVMERSGDSLFLQAFEKTYELDNTHQKAIFKVARHHLVKRRHSKSHQLIDQGLKSYPNNVELISLKAQNYFWQEDYEKAIIWFERLIALGESSELIHEKLSTSYHKNYETRKAIEQRKLALRYNPTDARAMYVIGYYYNQIQEYEKAEEYLSLALEILDESLSQEYRTLGTVYNRLKQYDKAIAALQKSLKEDPNDVSTEFFLLMSKDQYYADIDTKIALYEAFIEKHKEKVWVNFAQNRLKELKEEKFANQD